MCLSLGLLGRGSSRSLVGGGRWGLWVLRELCQLLGSTRGELKSACWRLLDVFDLIDWLVRVGWLDVLG